MSHVISWVLTRRNTFSPCASLYLFPFYFELLPITYLWPWMTSADLHRWRTHLWRYVKCQHWCPSYHQCPCMSYLVIRSENMAVFFQKLNWHIKNKLAFLSKSLSEPFPRKSKQKNRIPNEMLYPLKHFKGVNIGALWCNFFAKLL